MIEPRTQRRRNAVKLRAFAAALLFFCYGLSAIPRSVADTKGGQTFYTADAAPEIAAEYLLAQMDDGEILAQCLMFGWVGSEPSPLVLDWVKKRKIGGVKIFGWNTDNTRLLAEAVGTLQESAMEAPLAIPLLVATDQEGGWIRHVKGITSETPGNMAIGASGFPNDAYLAGYYIGRELAALGINMNFAPTVDIYTERRSTLIGPRSFGDDPASVGILGAAFAKGTAAAGLIATAKHYPGHGATELDSHGTLPLIDIDTETLWDRELVPYRILSKEGVPAIMSGHLAFTGTPAGTTPASVSSWFLGDMLRQRIGFEGMVITDDLLMYGLVTGPSDLPRVAKQALEAGNDMLLISKTPELNDQLWTRLLEAYKSDPVFRDRVRDAARRVLTLKARYLRSPLAPPLSPDSETLEDKIPDPEGRAFFQDLAARSVTRVLGMDNSLPPLKPESAGKVLLAGQFDDFFKAGLKAYPNAESIRFSYTPFYDAVKKEKAALGEAAAKADTIILCLANPAALEMLNSLAGLGKRVIALSVLTPIYLEDARWVDLALALYSYAPYSFTAGFSALLGKIPASGNIPFLFSEEGNEGF